MDGATVKQLDGGLVDLKAVHDGVDVTNSFLNHFHDEVIAECY